MCVGGGGGEEIIQAAHVSGFRISNGSHWHTHNLHDAWRGGDCVAVCQTNEHLEDEGWGGGGIANIRVLKKRQLNFRVGQDFLLVFLSLPPPPSSLSSPLMCSQTSTLWVLGGVVGGWMDGGGLQRLAGEALLLPLLLISSHFKDPSQGAFAIPCAGLLA